MRDATLLCRWTQPGRRRLEFNQAMIRFYAVQAQMTSWIRQAAALPGWDLT